MLFGLKRTMFCAVNAPIECGKSKMNVQNTQYADEAIILEKILARQ